MNLLQAWKAKLEGPLFLGIHNCHLFHFGIYLPLFAGAGVDAVEFIFPILLDMTPIFGVITLAVPLLFQTRVYTLGSLSS